MYSLGNLMDTSINIVEWVGISTLEAEVCYLLVPGEKIVERQKKDN